MMNFHTEVDGTVLENLDSSFGCGECGKFFATRYKLTRHARCHTGERPYACSFCNRMFSQTGNLKLHENKCQQSLVVSNQGLMQRDPTNQGLLQRDPTSHRNLEYRETETGTSPMNSGPSCSAVGSVNLDPGTSQLQHFEPMYISESEIQKTINETINSSVVDSGPSSYLIKTYENPIFIDDEIETMLDRDLVSLEPSKFSSTSGQDKLPLCLKQPETPELLHSLLYDD